jgi:protein-S-isoprenylcysteine O-methyltransferase Ste14
MRDHSSDIPGVIVFPPLIPLSILIVGIILNVVAPLDLLKHVPLLVRIIIGTIAFVVGLGMVIAAGRNFRQIGTNVNPSQPTLVLATTGIFRRTRNPMYVGGSLVLLGIATGGALDWVLLLLILSLPLVHYGIIRREESYLERKFGEEYRSYQKQVARYWWRF